MPQVEFGENIYAVQRKSAMALYDTFRQAEGDHCATVMRSIGEAIKIRAPFLAVKFDSGEYYREQELFVQGGGVRMYMCLTLGHERDEKTGRENVPARFVTIMDKVHSDYMLKDFRLPESRDGLAECLPIKIFDIATKEVCDAIEKITGVDIRSDLRTAVRQPQDRSTMQPVGRSFPTGAPHS